MPFGLPTKTQIQSLTLRAVVSYASRIARRLSLDLRGIVPDDELDHALQLIDNVATAPDGFHANDVAVIHAAERVTAAYAQAPEVGKSLQTSRIVFSIVNASIAASAACQCAVHPANARKFMNRAAEAARRTADTIQALERLRSVDQIEAAQKDFGTLLAEYGEHEEPVLGDPIRCFAP